MRPGALLLGLGCAVFAGASDAAAAQMGLAAVDVACMEACRDGGLATYLRSELRHEATWLEAPLEIAVTGWARLDDTGSSLLDVEELALRPAWGPVELRLGVGDVAWGISELRSPVDVLVPRAVLWEVARGRRLGQPVVGLSLFGSWGDVEAVAFPISRPAHLGGLLTETWDGHEMTSEEDWGEHPGWGVRFARALGRLDLALSYAHGSDRSFWGSPTSASDAVLEAPSLRQVGHELQWAVGSVVLHTEGAWSSRDGRREARALAGLEWFPAPYLSVALEQGIATSAARARNALVDDVLVAGRLIAETLRVGARLAIDPRSGNRHYALDAHWTAGPSVSIEGEVLGWEGAAGREPPLALRQLDTMRLSVVRYF